MTKKPERGRRRRKVSAEEAALFRSAMGDARELAGREERAATPPAGQTPPSRPAGGGAPPGGSGLPEIAAGEAVGVDTRTMERLRRGRLRPEARLDLHGMTQDEAHAALSAFLPRAQSTGRRCVIVITGRGRISEGGGVLRSQVPRWLNLAPLRPLILGYAEAQPRDGGAGALYVLLRRRRKSPD